MSSPPSASLPPASPSLLRHLINLDTIIPLTLYTLTQPFLPRPFLKLLEISGEGRLFFPILLSVLLSPLPSTSPTLRSLLINLSSDSILNIFIQLKPEIESVNKFVMVVIAWAGATSVSRVLLGRYFMFDVVAGAGLGIVNAFFRFWFFNSEFFSSIISRKLLS